MIQDYVSLVHSSLLLLLSHTSYITTSWINSTAFDSFLRKDWLYTSSIIINNNNHGSECTSYVFRWDKLFSNWINIIFTFSIIQLLLFDDFYFIFLQTFLIINLISVFWDLNRWIICVTFQLVSDFVSCNFLHGVNAGYLG